MAGKSTPKYEKRYFALLDILGFSEKVRERSPLASPERLQAIYAEIHKIFDHSELQRDRDINVELTLFSDTVIVSVPSPGSAEPQKEQRELILASFLWCIRSIVLLLLRNGFLSRGCILEGEIFHEQGLVVGPAIIFAHHFESKVANYPRVLIVGDLRSQIGQFQRFTKWVRRDDDGPMFLHVLYEFEKFSNEIPQMGRIDSEKKQAFTFIRNACDTIDRYLTETRDDPRLFEKNRWFARYMEKEIIKKFDKKDWPAWPALFDIQAYY